ncbi:MAG TPA: DegT/DnrJ/EryC1/StrS family aminotransferase [Gemmatimonadales bacterium]
MTVPLDFPLMEEADGTIVLFRPHVSARARALVEAQLSTRWIGQGPAVARFETEFAARFCRGLPAAAVGSGTDALHLAYLLAGVGPGDEVITPLFTCTATNIPLLYIGAKPVFADVQRDSLNIDVDHVRRLVTSRTRAIVCVHYGGLPCEMDELHAIAADAGVPVIEDAAHAVGASYHGRPIGGISPFTIFSFQAIKHITTGDGGMLVMQDQSLLARAQRLRWFGIDRAGKQNAIWDNDITDIGYKYQMTDIAAAMGLAALEEWDAVFALRRQLFATYERGLAGVAGVEFVGGGLSDRTHAAWLCTVFARDRIGLQRKLREHRIESNQVHYRNDRYSIFRESRGAFPNMDSIEHDYLVLPLHTHMTAADAERVVDVIRSGW